MQFERLPRGGFFLVLGATLMSGASYHWGFYSVGNRVSQDGGSFAQGLLVDLWVA